MSTALVRSSQGVRYAPVRIPKNGEKILAVIVVIDMSGSMSEMGKIESANFALSSSVREIQKIVKKKQGVKALFTVIGFGQTANVLIGPETFDKVTWKNLRADQNGTFVAPAIELLNRELAKLLQGRRGFQPVVALVSDGLVHDQPAAMNAINEFLNSKWGGRAIRVGVGISGEGGECDLAILKAFISNPEQQPYVADDAAKLGQFIKWTLLSSAATSMADPSLNQQQLFPALPPLLAEDEEEEDEEELIN
jgi:uncharacterized protein YegL